MPSETPDQELDPLEIQELEISDPLEITDYLSDRSLEFCSVGLKTAHQNTKP